MCGACKVKVLEESSLDRRICRTPLILRDPGYVKDSPGLHPSGRRYPIRELEDPMELHPNVSDGVSDPYA